MKKKREREREREKNSTTNSGARRAIWRLVKSKNPIKLHRPKCGVAGRGCPCTLRPTLPGWAASKLSVKMAWIWVIHFPTTRHQRRVKLMQAASSRIREIWLWYLNRDLDRAEAGLKPLAHNNTEWLNRAAKALSLTLLSLVSRGTNRFYFLRLTSYLRKKWPLPPGRVLTNLL